MACDEVTRDDAGRWVLPWGGREVDQICVDFAVTFVVDGCHSVRIGTAFTAQVGQQAHQVDPADIQTVAPVLAFHRAVVRSAVAEHDGTLRIDFEGGLGLLAPPDPADEAWEIDGGLPPVTPGYRLVAKRGGGVLVGGRADDA